MQVGVPSAVPHLTLSPVALKSPAPPLPFGNPAPSRGSGSSSTSSLGVWRHRASSFSRLQGALSWLAGSEARSVCSKVPAPHPLPDRGSGFFLTADQRQGLGFGWGGVKGVKGVKGQGPEGGVKGVKGEGG